MADVCKRVSALGVPDYCQTCSALAFEDVHWKSNMHRIVQQALGSLRAQHRKEAPMADKPWGQVSPPPPPPPPAPTSEIVEKGGRRHLKAEVQPDGNEYPYVVVQRHWSWTEGAGWTWGWVRNAVEARDPTREGHWQSLRAARKAAQWALADRRLRKEIEDDPQREIIR